MSVEKTDLIYNELVNFRQECRAEFTEIKSNARAHAQEMHEHKQDVEGRLDKLEEPRKALNQLKKWALWAASMAAGVAAVGKFMEWL